MLSSPPPSLQWSDFSQSAETVIRNEKVEKARKKSNGGWSQYTPHIHVTTTSPLPTIVELINQQERVYYRYEDEKNWHEGEDDLSVDDLADSEAMNKTAKSILDLGVAPLQRIIYEMKHLTTNSKTSIDNDSSSKNISLVQEARKIARDSGLDSYCDYLTNTSIKSRIDKKHKERMETIDLVLHLNQNQRKG